MKRLQQLSELTRLPDEGILCGVCAGLADYYGWRVRTVRFIVAVLALMVTWPVILAYIAACFLLPTQEEREEGGDPAPRRRAGEASATKTKTRPSYSGPLRERYQHIETRMRRVEAYLHGHEYQLRTAFRDLESG